MQSLIGNMNLESGTFTIDSFILEEDLNEEPGYMSAASASDKTHYMTKKYATSDVWGNALSTSDFSNFVYPTDPAKWRRVFIENAGYELVANYDMDKWIVKDKHTGAVLLSGEFYSKSHVFVTNVADNSKLNYDSFRTNKRIKY